MRTTLTIDDDVLHLAKEIAAAEHRTAGEVISETFRKGLTASPTAGAQPYPSETDAELAALGVHPFSGGTVVTNAQVNRLREELGI